jgi:hypothetical protein
MIFNSDTKTIQLAQSFQQMMFMYKNIKLDPYLVLHAKLTQMD